METGLNDHDTTEDFDNNLRALTGGGTTGTVVPEDPTNDQAADQKP